jgi:CBS-domain-containing membrane protein
MPRHAPPAPDDGPGGLLGGIQSSLGELGVGLYCLVLSAAVLLAVGLIGIARKEPWVFPSLGPTVMLFFETPLQRAASAKNAVVGHLVGILVGAACLWAWHLEQHQPVILEGLTHARIVAAATSVAVTAVILRAIRSPHPPAGATTLIVSLGILRTGLQLRVMMSSVVVVTVLAVVVNRLVGVRHPLISPDRV